MNKEKVFLTKDGYALMQQELDQAKKILYEEIPEKLKTSKINGGDLRENKEYMYLQGEQQYYEREVRRLASVLELAEVIPDEEILDEDMRDKVKVKEPLVIDVKKIKKKGKEALKILENYQKILSLVVTGEINIAVLVDINKVILDMLKDDKELLKEANQVFTVVDSLLWDDAYTLKDGQRILKSIENVYKELMERR